MPRPWVLLALLATWCLGLIGRNAWTPDEPRELALSASQRQAFTALPLLGGQPFTEKPPLAYWLSGAAMRVLGASAAAARTPSLPYAVLACGSVYLLGRRMATAATGATAALVFATSWLVFNTQIWLACDALLLAAVSLALLGIYEAFGRAVRGREFLAGCACMHAGLLLALFAKSLAGWLVPVSTLVIYLALERRLRDLLRPAAWLPLLGSLALLLLWVRTIAVDAGGHDSLRALFWDNLVGRFASYADSRVVHELGHPNWPGKYLAELPVYLLPWTPLLVAAVAVMWRDAGKRSAIAAPVRFALSACLPALLILSVASTARGVYAAPLVPGLALFVAIVLTTPDTEDRSRRIARNASRWTALLLISLDGGLLATAAAISILHSPADAAGLCASLAGLACLVFLGVRAIRSFDDVAGAVMQLAGAHLVALVAISLALFPLFNRSQDLERMAAFVESASGGRPLVLWQPDETTLALSDLYLRKPACVVSRAQPLSNCLERYPRAAVVALGDCPPAECGSVLDFIRRADPMQRRNFDVRDAALRAAGVVVAGGLVRAGGRAYLVGMRTP